MGEGGRVREEEKKIHIIITHNNDINLAESIRSTALINITSSLSLARRHDFTSCETLDSSCFLTSFHRPRFTRVNPNTYSPRTGLEVSSRTALHFADKIWLGSTSNALSREQIPRHRTLFAKPGDSTHHALLSARPGPSHYLPKIVPCVYLL